MLNFFTGLRGGCGQLLGPPPGSVAFVVCWIDVPQISPDIFKEDDCAIPDFWALALVILKTEVLVVPILLSYSH